MFAVQSDCNLGGTVTSHQNVAVGCSVNVFKMKKGRLNPNS